MRPDRPETDPTDRRTAETTAPAPGVLLGGIRVLDLTDASASFCAKVLADLGAEVIKVERPGGTRSPTRDAPPTEAELRSAYHDAGKRRVTLDLEAADGPHRLLELAEAVDVVVESSPPGYLSDLGCSYEALRQANPGIVLASVTAFGQTGPRRGFRSNDLVAAAYGGQMYVSGDPTGTPLRAYGEQSSSVASLFAAVGILLALMGRRVTGRGEHVDVSTQEAVAGTLDHVMVRYLADGIVVRRRGSLSWNGSTFVLPCRDGYLHVDASVQWQTLVEWVAGEGMAGDLPHDRWSEADERRNPAEIIDVLERWTLTHTVDELVETAQALRLPWAPVARPAEVLASPQLRARGFFRPLELPGRGVSALCPGMPYQFGHSSPSRSGHFPAEARAGNAADRTTPADNAGDTAAGCGGRVAGRTLPPERSSRPLAGIRIIDLTWVLAGPFATRLLADAGAEVIKVQSLRTAKTPTANLDRYFATWNRNKRSITLDPGRPAGRELLRRLAGVSDVVIENFSPRVMANWGLTYPELARDHERLIMLSISAMGQTGPWRDRVAFGPGLHAFSGLTYLSSVDETRPLGLGYALGDHVLGLYGALAVLAALEHRTRAGRGLYVDLSGYEALCTLLGPALMSASLDRAPIPRGNRPGDAAPCACYPCSGTDRWCVVSVSSDDEWRRLCGVIGRPDLLSHDRTRTASGRGVSEALLDEALGHWTAERTAEEAVCLLQEAGVTAGVVMDATDLLRDPHLAARQFFVHLEHPVLGRILTDRSPIRFAEGEASDGPAAPLDWEPAPPDWAPAPQLGEDNRSVFRELLGLSEQAFSRLQADGVIQ